MNRLDLHKRRLSNLLQSLLLLASMSTLLSVLAWLLGGPLLAGIALALVLGGYFLNPLASPQILLRFYKATPIQPREAPGLYIAVEQLAERARLNFIPRLYHLPTPVMNAFTVGSRPWSAIAISEGLLRRLDTREIVAVLAHEISHIQHNDLKVMSLADLTSRFTRFLSWTGQFLLLLNLPLLLFGPYHINWPAIAVLIMAPTFSAMIQLALSRNREFDADLGAARLLGDPVPLASALEKMDRLQGSVWERLFLPYRRTTEPSILRTHPTNAERIERLLSLNTPEHTNL